jgi:hypothetical protein
MSLFGSATFGDRGLLSAPKLTPASRQRPRYACRRLAGLGVDERGHAASHRIACGGFVTPPVEVINHVVGGLAFRRGAPPQAIFLFKHALVQDAAYGTLLRGKRQELHGRVAHDRDFPMESSI